MDGFKALEGANACGTGYGRTAGFLMPTAALLANEVTSPVNDDADIKNDAETFASFFADTCVPGPGALSSDDDATWDNLCTAEGCDCESEEKGGVHAGRLWGWLAQDCY